MKIRINNIEIREYTSTKKDKPFYEIIKWYPNIYFGKEEEYIKDGYVDNGDSLKKEKPQMGHSISKNAFTLPESCYVIAFIEKGSDWQLRSVGERLLELTPEEWNDFHQVYTLGQSKLNKLWI